MRTGTYRPSRSLTNQQQDSDACSCPTSCRRSLSTPFPWLGSLRVIVHGQHVPRFGPSGLPGGNRDSILRWITPGIRRRCELAQDREVVRLVLKASAWRSFLPKGWRRMSRPRREGDPLLPRLPPRSVQDRWGSAVPHPRPRDGRCSGSDPQPLVMGAPCFRTVYIVLISFRTAFPTTIVSTTELVRCPCHGAQDETKRMLD